MFGDSPFFQPGNTYGGTQDWYNTPLVSNPNGGLSALSPGGEFERYLANEGYAGFDRRSQFGQNQYGRTRSGHQAAAMNNPDLTYRDYLNQHLSGFGDIWRGLTPDQRGESPNRYAGPIRWSGRG